MIEPTVFSLPNGLRVVHFQVNREVCHAGLVIDAGSGEENEAEHGIAHLIEHLLFKGTKKRRAFHVLSRLDSVGGEINAYTTKEDTWILEAFLNEHFDRAMELMADIAFNSVFPAHEMEKEKEVILDEINAYEDNPGDMIFDEFEEMIFHGHALGRSILGTPDTVRRISKVDIEAFVKRHYSPENMVLSVVGNISEAKMRRVAEKYFGYVAMGGEAVKRTKPSIVGARHVIKEKDTHQLHYMLGNRAPGAHDTERVAMGLLNNVLGGPALNSRLNMAIREKHGFTYFIESHYQAYHHTGYFQIYLGTDEKNFAKSKSLVWKELKKLKTQSLSPTQLHAAKQQMLGQLALARDSGSGLMANLGKSLQVYGKVDSNQELAEAINKVTATEIIEMANVIFNPEAMSSLTYR